MGMKIWMAIAAFALLALVAGCGAKTERINGVTGNLAAEVTASGEPIRLSSDDNGQYSPREIRVKAGSTVRIEGDLETLVGGMDTVVVEGYGVSKRIAPGDNVLEFVADKPGEFEVRCANGMGNARLVVEA